MRILLLNSEAELYNNGGDKVLLLTAEILADDHHITALLPEQGPLVEAMRSLGIRCDVMPYAIAHRSTAQPVNAMRYVVALLASTFRVWRFARRHRIDVVYSNSLGVVEGCILRLLGGPRHIWHVHNMIDGAAIANRAFSWLVAHGADTAICVSGAARDHLRPLGENLKIVWNGIPPVVPEPGFALVGRPPTIAVVGRFNEHKGQADMVEAAAILRDAGYDFRLRLVGATYRNDVAPLRKVERLIASLDLGDKVQLEKGVTDIGRLYAEVDLVVVPSVLLDSFPTVGLEAMSAGKPVAGYATGGLAEMLDFDTDCLAPGRDVKALAAVVGRFLDDEEFRLRKARQQHERYLAHFTLPRYRERIVAAVQDDLEPART